MLKTSSFYDGVFDSSKYDSKEMLQNNRENRVWDIFTTYSIQASASEPFHIRMTHVLKLLKDCGVVKSSAHPTAKLSSYDIDLLALAVLKKYVGTTSQASKLTYKIFLDLLWKIAFKAFPEIDPDQAFCKLLDEYILKLEKKRICPNFSADPFDGSGFLIKYKGPLAQIFQYYVDSTRNRLSFTNVPKSNIQAIPNMKHKEKYLLYEDCLQFGYDYGIISVDGVTVMEFGQLIISCLRKMDGSHFERYFDLQGFYHLIHLVAEKAFGFVENTSENNRLKCLFLLMWKSKNTRTSSPVSMKKRNNYSLKESQISGKSNEHGSDMFIELFYSMWKQEKFCNYLSLDKPATPSKDVLLHSSMMNSLFETPVFVNPPPIPEHITMT